MQKYAIELTEFSSLQKVMKADMCFMDARSWTQTLRNESAV